MNNEIFDRIDKLMKIQNKQQKEMNEYLKLNQKTYDNWKAGKSSSYLKYLHEIATFLGVTPNYLIYGEEKFSDISEFEQEILNALRPLSENYQRIVLRLIKAFPITD